MAQHLLVHGVGLHVFAVEPDALVWGVETLEGLRQSA